MSAHQLGGQLFVKFVKQKAQAVVKLLFHKHLLVTNCLISAGMGAAGDAVHQHYQVIRGEKPAWQPVRAAHMSTAGFTTGIVCHYWYIWLDRWLPGRCIRTVLKKVVYDQVIFSPVVWITYFTTLGILEGSTSETVKEELLEKGGKIYLLEWVIWPPAQMINFYVLPTRYRIVFDNMISFGFDVYCPHIKYSDSKKSTATNC